MKVTVVYGGRGLIEDPALYVLEKIQMVLDELRVEVQRINLYEERTMISTLPATLKDTDGVVLASSVEWFGIGGYMQEFLDACFLYADKEKLKSIYMMPVVMATTSGEKDAMLALEKAWEILGGMLAEGICAYVENPVDFEMNKAYGKLIEKRTEQLYRVINQKMATFPSSCTVIRTTVLKPKTLELTPQESEQLSKFVSDDSYVKKQKQDIEELSAKFKGMLQAEEEKENLQQKYSGEGTIKNLSKEISETPSRQAITTPQDNEQAFQTPKDSASDHVVPGTPLLNESGKNTETRLFGNTQAASIQSQVIPGNFSKRFETHFHKEEGFSATYLLNITDKDEMMQLKVEIDQLKIIATRKEEGDVIIRVDSGVLNDITLGKMTFQQAFMGGDLKVKGNFKTLRMLDQIFRFS